MALRLRVQHGPLGVTTWTFDCTWLGISKIVLYHIKYILRNIIFRLRLISSLHRVTRFQQFLPPLRLMTGFYSVGEADIWRSVRNEALHGALPE